MRHTWKSACRCAAHLEDCMQVCGAHLLATTGRLRLNSLRQSEHQSHWQSQSLCLLVRLLEAVRDGSCYVSNSNGRQRRLWLLLSSACCVAEHASILHQQLRSSMICRSVCGSTCATSGRFLPGVLALWAVTVLDIISVALPHNVRQHIHDGCQLYCTGGQRGVFGLIVVCYIVPPTAAQCWLRVMQPVPSKPAHLFWST